MNITFDALTRMFLLDTKNSSYVIAIIDDEGFLGHAYYGKKLSGLQGVRERLRTEEAPFTPAVNARDRLSFLDSFPTEYAGHGLGDFRESSCSVRTLLGHSAVSFFYVSHEISKGKKALEGLPATFGKDEECMTLEIVCKDPVLSLQAVLSYSVFAESDAIARSIRITNQSADDIMLTKVMSSCMDMDHRDYESITLHGSWARERRMQRKPLGIGKYSISSLRGEGGHQDHPFLAVLPKETTQTQGDVYGVSFVYSGNFEMLAEINQFGSLRLMAGINPVDFSWKLGAGESFQAPEVIHVYSSEGIGGMTRTYHDLYRRHLIRSAYRNKKRPILINNWEATYFDFNTDKLLAIAKEASAMGIEMLVMDDGWFGERSSDNMALGDWVVNEQKLEGGLEALSKGLQENKMKFGIWFEPEMISPDSDLYRQHPDWAIRIPGREPGLARNQCVLDISRKEVRDTIMDMVMKVLRSADISYVKWDMNRPLSDLGSAELPTNQQGELFHRYVLGLYEMQERLVQAFPDLLLENCSGGGARFDPGMLYYSPQIWCSDDTDAVERLAIQEGTAMVYPLSSIGAHVSVCPNHTVGRTTPFETRGYVALAGTFGYELDVTKLSSEDKDMVKKQVEMYHRWNDLVREGDYYRIASYQENHEYDCFQVVSKDKAESLLFFVQVMGRPNSKSRNLLLQGLDYDTNYYFEEADMHLEQGVSKKVLDRNGSEWVVSGCNLMHVGIQMPRLWGDFQAKLLYMHK